MGTVLNMYALFYLPAPFLCNGGKISFAVRLAAMPGRHSDDQVHKANKNAAPPFLTPVLRAGELLEELPNAVELQAKYKNDGAAFFLTL